MKPRTRLGAYAIASLLALPGCLHFEETFLMDAGAGDDAQGGAADASVAADADAQQLTISVGEEVLVREGEEVSFAVTVARPAGVSGAVALVVNDLPSGVTAEVDDIAEDENNTNVRLTASAGADLGSATLSIEGSVGGATGMASVPVFVAGITGAFDRSFAGGAGIALPTASEVKDMLLTPDGRLLVLANESGWNVIAFAEDGSLDTSYGVSGRAALPDDVNAEAMHLRPSGGIVIAVNHISPVQAGIVALTESGGLDVSYNSGTSFISTISAGGGRTTVRDIVMDDAGIAYMAGQHGNGNIGAIYRFPADGVFANEFISNADATIWGNVRLHDGKLLVGGNKSGLPVYVLARYETSLAIDSTFANSGLFESVSIPRNFSHFDVDSSGRIGVTMVDQNAPDYQIDFLDANASSITDTQRNIGTGSSNFGGDGRFGTDGTYHVVINGCSASCTFHDSEIVSMRPDEATEGDYSRDSEMRFTIDDSKKDTRWQLGALVTMPDGRIVVAGDNGGVTTILRIWD